MRFMTHLRLKVSPRGPRIIARNVLVVELSHGVCASLNFNVLQVAFPGKIGMKAVWIGSVAKSKLVDILGLGREDVVWRT